MTSDPSLTKLLGAVYSFKASSDGKEVLKKNLPLILCGVSASGKNSVANVLIKLAAFDRIVTYTTRKPRDNDGKTEEQGIDYWFVSNEQMFELIESGSMLEVQAIHGQTVYGTSIKSLSDIAATGKRAIWQPDINGVLFATKIVPTLKPIFLLPPSFDIWMERLGSRGFISDGEKERRLHSAKVELEGALRNRTFIFMINSNASQTAKDILNGEGGSAAQHAAHVHAEELLGYISTM